MTFWSEDIECQSIGIIFRILIYITNGEVFLLHNHNMFVAVEWEGGQLRVQTFYVLFVL